MPTKEEVSDALSVAAQAASATSAVPGIAGVISKIAAVAFGVASKIAKAGGDPVLEIERMLSAVPGTKDAEKDWSAALESKFGSDDGSGDERDTHPGMRSDDPYEDL